MQVFMQIKMCYLVCNSFKMFQYFYQKMLILILPTDPTFQWKPRFVLVIMTITGITVCEVVGTLVSL